jgi:hypothetical protein
MGRETEAKRFYMVMMTTYSIKPGHKLGHITETLIVATCK